MFRGLFSITPVEKEQAVKRLIENSYPGAHFFILVLLSVLIATIGLALDNAAIIIGSMLVAPFLYPILSLGVSIVLADFELLRRSVNILIKSILLAVIISTLFTFFLDIPQDYNVEIISRSKASLPYLYVAIAAGAAASFSVVNRKLHEYLIGVAVSVAVLPPLAAVGIGFGTFAFGLAFGALQLFFVNLLGVVSASLVIFSLMGFYVKRSVASDAIKKEEKKLEKEKQAHEE